MKVLLNKGSSKEHLQERLLAFTSSIPTNINTIIVTKNQPPWVYETCFQNHFIHIGENKVQELKEKRTEYQNLDLKYHFIGPLQTNKIKYFIEYIYSVDSISDIKQLTFLNEHMQKTNRTSPLPVLIQINSTLETQKSGILINDFKKLETLISMAQELKFITIEGFLTMGPTPDNNTYNYHYQNKVQDAFHKTHQLQRKCEIAFQIKLPRLSMGMSHDYKIAIDNGCTEIRIGSLLFQ